MRNGRSRRRTSKGDREIAYGLLFVAGIALLLAAILLAFNLWS